MDPLMITFLVGYGASIFANITPDVIGKIATMVKPKSLQTMFIKAFLTSLDYHDKHYDNTSKKYISIMRKAVKRNPNKLLLFFCKFSRDIGAFLSSITTGEFKKEVAKEIIGEFDIKQANGMVLQIITDCLQYYRNAFIEHMNKDQAIQMILMECLKINTVLEQINRLNLDIATKSDIDALRKSILALHYAKEPTAVKTRKYYDGYIRKKFKYIEMRGLSPKVSGREVNMELVDVFVPLKVKIGTSGVTNVIKEEVGYKGVSLERSEPEKKEPEKEDILDQIVSNNNIVILGDPGSGKSTLLKYLAVKITKLRNTKSPLATLIPIYCRVSEYADVYKKTKITLYEYITGKLDVQYGHLFKEGLECFNIILFLDGLDEVTDTPLRMKVGEQITDFMARYPYNRYIVTSRIVGYHESRLTGEVTHYRLMPFDKEKIELFSHQWYKSIAKHTDKDFEHASQQADDLYQAILRNKSVIRLASNPLLMTVVAMIHYKGMRLPNKRVQLYDISTETFLEYWVQHRVLDESKLKDKNEIIEILAPIAFDMHMTTSSGLIEQKQFEGDFLKYFCQIHTSAKPNLAKAECVEFIDFLRKQAGFFYEKGVDEKGDSYYGFAHQTFQEYLAAIDLTVRWNQKTIDLHDFIFNPRWTEILRLAAAHLASVKGRYGRVQATNFVKEILSVNDPFPEACRPLQLVCLILADDVNVEDGFVVEISKDVIETIKKSIYNELVFSFSRLFGEILNSDYSNVFSKEIKHAFRTKSARKSQQIISLIMSNSENSALKETLIKLCKKNSQELEFLRALCRQHRMQYSFQTSKVFKKACMAYLNIAEETLDIRVAAGALLSCVNEKYWPSQWVTDKSLLLLDTLQNEPYFDNLFRVYLLSFLDDVLSHGNSEDLISILSRYPKSVLSSNLSRALLRTKINNVVQFMNDHALFRPFFNTDYYILAESGHKKFALSFVTTNMESLWQFVFEQKDPYHCIKTIQENIPNLELDLIEMAVHWVLGPLEDSVADDISNFIKAYKREFFYGFFGWESFPLLTGMKYDPVNFSKCLVEHPQLPYYRGYDEEKIKKQLEDGIYDADNVSPFVKLRVLQELKEDISEELIACCIQDFKNCTDKEKEGAFSILYSTLNPFEL